MDPAASAAVIRNHVAFGLELAAKHRIPRTVAAFIPEHHGTSPITYFLEKSAGMEGVTPNPDEFRYPGPTPRSAETAVVMLADGVEAAARVLNDPTPERLNEVVSHLVRLRIEQGQLADAPLTLQQLDVIKEEFTRILSAAHHSRIEYPASAGGVTATFAT
jgi:membrane-associated HD superfamily phosphohydrolase